MLRKPALALALVASLGTAACTDSHGRVDPVATGLLGAGVGAAAGLAIASASRPRRPVYRDSGWGHPSHGQDHGFARPHWGRAGPGWGHQAYGYGGGWGGQRYRSW